MKKEANILQLEKDLKNKKVKLVAMIAPSFAAEFDYPCIVCQLKELGFDKVVELTFGAKMINREYHKILESPESKNKLLIASVCPGIVEAIKNKFPQLSKNIILVDSPMTAMAKICKKAFPKHKSVFIGPCNFKKMESLKCKNIDFAIDYQELHQLLCKYNVKPKEIKVNELRFDKFYNDYTKVYPITGGLSKTAHLKGAIKKNEIKVIDGILDVEKFLKNSKAQKGIRFLDVNFCKGGCIGGPALSKNLTLAKKKKRILQYLNLAKTETIPESRKGEIKEAEGIEFYKKSL
jgi:iron only hydrogenase large subunit-like protein